MLIAALILTALAMLHIGTALARFDLNDWTLAFAVPIWGLVLLTAWGFYILFKLTG